MASGQQIFDAAQELIAARVAVADRQAEFDDVEAQAQATIAAQQAALDAARLVYATAQDAARNSTPGWQAAQTALNQALLEEAVASGALLALTFDGT